MDIKTRTLQKLNVSRGNKKLISNDETLFLIWNLPAIKTCPYATEHCKAACYARKAEKVYPDCLPSREKNFNESRKETFTENMIYTIESALKNDRKKRNIVFRIHESGDFYNREYAQKWLAIMRHFENNKKVVFIAYTKSFVYFDGEKLPKNFKLRASIWDDTNEQQRRIVLDNNWPIYTAVDKFQIGDKFTRCRCKDCATCKKCWQGYKDIRCEIH